MRIIAVIPARYKSSRFEGKPLADIHGKPMIWWVYQQVKKARRLDEVYVATDDERIEAVCHDYGMNVIMTSDTHLTPTDRLHEVSNLIDAEIYISVNGDEPLIQPETIESIIPPHSIDENEIYVSNLVSEIVNPVELADPSNLKVVINRQGKGIYISRSVVPFPKGSQQFNYKKHLGVYAFNKKSLNFYADTKRGLIEEIEDIDLLRYIENNIQVNFYVVSSSTLSVDTKSDLEVVRIKMLENDKKGVNEL